MEVELQWVKKLKSKTNQNYFHCFLIPCNFNQRSISSTKGAEFKPVNAIEAVDAFRKGVRSIRNVFNLHNAVKNLPSLEIFRNKTKNFLLKKKRQVVNIKSHFSTLRAAKTVLNQFLTFSLSFLKQTYPHSWKTIFVHFFKKTNLLVRSDNNTGFSSSKVLQTTTI